MRNVVAEHGLESRSSEFEAAINNGDRSSLKVLCERKSQESEYVLNFQIFSLIENAISYINLLYPPQD